MRTQFAIGGAGRAKLAAAIMASSTAWGVYANTHGDALADAGREPLVICNASGEVIERAAKLDLLTNADGTVRHEDFLTIRDRLVEIRERELNGIADLRAAGLTFNEPITSQIVGFENHNDFPDAERDMNPNAYQNNDSVFSESYVPCPIMHQSFDVIWRQQGFDYKRSVGLERTARKVLESAEDLLFNGDADIVVNFNGTNFPIYGYTTHPNRGLGTISDWTDEANASQIVKELIQNISEMWAEQGGIRNGSVMVYVANDIWNNFQNDYKSDYPSKPILDRMRDVVQVMDVKPAEKLAAGEVVLVEMDSRTIELCIEADLTVVPHTKTAPFEPQTFTTYAAMVPQIKVDGNGQTGIRHLTPA